MEGGSTALPIKLVSPSSTTSQWRNSNRGYVPMGRGGSRGCNGRVPASVPDSQMQPPTVVHESAHYIVVEDSPALSPLPSSVTAPGGLPPAPLDSIRSLIPPSRGGGSRRGTFCQWGGACTCCGAPNTLVPPCGGALWSRRPRVGCWRRRWRVLPFPLGWRAWSQHSSGPTCASGEADLKHTCDCPRCMVHNKTCIDSLLARDLKSQKKDLQRFHQELSPAVAGVTGISRSYRDPMTRILSTVAKQDEVVQGCQQEFGVVAASVADHVKMSNNNTAKFV